jgi:hypothetical protein
MPAHHGDDYQSLPAEVWKQAEEAEGEESYSSRYPLLYPPDAWDVMSMLELEVSGIEYRQHEREAPRGDGRLRTVLLAHPDGSWARADAVGFLASPIVYQGGPQRLWDELERIRNRLNRGGSLPVYGARVTVTPDGETTLSRGKWSITL